MPVRRGLARTRYAVYWKKKYDETDSFVHENGGVILAEQDYPAYKRMGDFYRHVGNILATLADIVQPRSFEELTQYGFDDDPDDKS
jgi:internalin A